MWNSKRAHIDDEKLDRFSEELLHALDAGEMEVNAAGNSPFLYRRIRVRIEAEERRRAGDRGKLFMLFTEARHAIPVLALITVIAIGLVWYSPSHSIEPSTFYGSSSASQAPMSSEMPGLSNDEIITSLVGWNDRKEQQ